MTSPRSLQHLFTGRDIDLLNIQPQDITISDIAHALAMTCRFGGHSSWHYSVAQHSIYVAERVFHLTGSANVARVALLHDASEAYLGDIVRPLKLLDCFREYRLIELQTQRRIYDRFGLLNLSEKFEKLVEEVDNMALVRECDQLFEPAFKIDTEKYGDPDAAGWFMVCGRMQPRGAEMAFLEYFREPSKVFSHFHR
jgi:uncharacterized protein